MFLVETGEGACLRSRWRNFTVGKRLEWGATSDKEDAHAASTSESGTVLAASTGTR